MRENLDLHGRILVADDEKTNADFFRLMLTKIGFDVDVAYDGQEVMEKVDSFAPDLILLDLLMPKISGFEVAEKLKKGEKTREIPIVVLSAVDDVKGKVDLLGLGIDDYITKPFNFIEIIARIRNILKSKTLKEEVEQSKRGSRLLEELDSALRQFLTRAPGRAAEILSALEALAAEEAGKPADRAPGRSPGSGRLKGDTAAEGGHAALPATAARLKAARAAKGEAEKPGHEGARLEGEGSSHAEALSRALALSKELLDSVRLLESSYARFFAPPGDGVLETPGR